MIEKMHREDKTSRERQMREVLKTISDMKKSGKNTRVAIFIQKGKESCEICPLTEAIHHGFPRYIDAQNRQHCSSRTGPRQSISPHSRY